MDDQLKVKALSFLAKREYGYQELFDKLRKYTDDEQEIAQLLQQLVDANYLSEERYIKNYVLNKSKRYGMLKIQHILKHKANDMELVEQIIKTNEIDELENALHLWRKKFITISHDKKELAKRIRFLQNKGFSFSIIKQVIKLQEEGD